MLVHLHQHTNAKMATICNIRNNCKQTALDS